MSSRVGRALSVQIFGESHGAAVGVTIDGLPAGIALDEAALAAFVSRRAAKGSAIATGRRESDLPKIISGLCNGHTTGYPLTAIFENADTHSSDYSFLPDQPRPGHADYPALVKSGGWDDLRGSGHHSGRLTLPYVFAGGVALQALEALGVQIAARVYSIGDIQDDPIDECTPDWEALLAARQREIPTVNEAAGKAMKEAILAAKAEQNSVGGVVEIIALNVPAGLGAPYFEGVEAVLGQHLFSIPAVKGVEFGAGFQAALMNGSAYNDPYEQKGQRIGTTRNKAGGLCGGLTTGMPVIARAAFRPTASIAQPQQTVSLGAFKAGEEASRELTVHGRHDPCVVVRAVPVAESAMALGLFELWIQHNGDKPFQENA
ncbi:MAG: chorismate synthase [Eubacteriales bacterium]|nr:chorismate synthase [Eubacteriales bacterium]